MTGLRRLLALAALVVAGALASAAAQDGPAERWFETETTRADWRDPPPGMELDTPRGAVRTFLIALEQGRAEAAAAALHLPQRSLHPPAELARMLGEVVERRLWLDLSDLPDRRDAATEPPLSQGVGLGEPRRSLLLGELEADGWPVSIRLNRLKPPDAEPVWVFAQSTVDMAPPLYAEWGPGWVEGRLPAWWLERSLGWTQRWEVAGFAALIAAAWLAGWIVYKLLEMGTRPFSHGWMRRAFDGARAPLALVVAATSGRILTHGIVGFSAPITNVVNPVFLALAIFGVVWAALRVIDAGLDVVTRRFVGEGDGSENREERRFYTSIYALRRFVVLAAFLFGTGLLLFELDAFSGLGLSLLASAGIAAAVLGVAAQTVLGNILASLQIALAKPIRIGDSVLYEDEWAYVESIYYTFVRLRTWDNRRYIVPVQYFISHPFENWTMQDSKMTRTFWLVFDHAADTDAIRRKYVEIATADEDVIAEEMLKMLVLDHGPQGVRCRFYATAKDPSTAWNMHARLQEAVLGWVRREHPEWWPRERVADAEGRRNETAAAA